MVVSSAYLRFLGLGLKENGSFGRTHPHVVDGCSFTKLFFSPHSWRVIFFPLDTGTPGKKRSKTKGPGRKKNWNNMQMLERQNLCRLICIVAPRVGPPLTRGVVVWHLLSREKLLYGHGSHGKLSGHTTYWQGLVKLRDLVVL